MYGPIKEHLTEELEKIRESGLYKDERILTSRQSAHVSVRDGREVLNMCANNYLGLSGDPRLIEAARKTIEDWGYGLSSVRFICGTQSIHKQLEDAVTDVIEPISSLR